MLLLGNLGQQLDIGDIQEEIARLRAEVESRGTADPGERMRALEDQVAELRLYVSVLLRIVTSKGLVTQDQLRRLAEALDSADGTQDGRFTGKDLT
jgi:hypothetical protein